MAAAIISMLSEIPGELVKTITCDRGSEFSEWKEIDQKLNCNMYSADLFALGKKEQMKT